jgi:Ser-tRNA(Ala) deacylase AlaX
MEVMIVHIHGDEERRRRDIVSNEAHRLSDQVRLCRVVAGHGKHWVILGSPLLSSQPGCVGDRGTTGGTLVVDVVDEDCGPLHLFESRPLLRLGGHVLIALDREHRTRVARTHTAMLLARREMEKAGAKVASTEVIAGKAWINFSGDAAEIDLAPAMERDEPLHVFSREIGNEVWIGNQSVETYRAPVVKRTGEIGKTVVEHVKAGPTCERTLQVRLLD